MTAPKTTMDENFVKLFKYLEDFRKEINEKFEENHADHQHIYDAIDGFAGQIDDFKGEQAALVSQTSRHESQIEYIADSLSIDLTKATA